MREFIHLKRNYSNLHINSHTPPHMRGERAAGSDKRHLSDKIMILYYGHPTGICPLYD
jgi:hypothetical protein